MRRRTLDIIVSSGAVLLAGLLLALGLILDNRGDFAKSYVADELGVQKITFPEADKINEADRAFTEARTGCVVTYAGQQLSTGSMAECYANEYIGSHLTYLATRLGRTSVADVDGMSYTELGAEQGRIRTEISDLGSGNEAAVEDLEQRLEDVTYVRQKVFEGQMLRNALLTSFAFSEFGVTAGKASNVAFTVAGLLLLIAIAGFAHSLLTPRSRGFAIPEPEAAHAKREREKEKVLVS